VDRALTGPGGTAHQTLAAGRGGYEPYLEGATIDLTATGDTPAVILELTVIPAAPSGAPSPSPTGE
jgi:hypothetical protein